MEQLSDQQLLGMYLKGDHAAFELLFNRHHKRIFTSIYLLVNDRDLANDIFQDTFIKVIDRLKKKRYTEEGKFLPWVLRIAHNLCIDHFRGNKRMPIVHSKEDKDVFATIGAYDESEQDKIIRSQTCQQVRDWVNQLPAEQREVVVLRHYANFSFKEIAKLTNTNINTALGRMRYALINLRKQAEQSEEKNYLYA